MSIFDLPTKMVESAENLTEKKFELTVRLLNTYYANKKPPANIPEMLESYDVIFKHLKKLTPRPQENFYVKHFKIVIMGFLILFVFIMMGGGLLFYKYGFQQIFDVITKFFNN